MAVGGGDSAGEPVFGEVGLADGFAFGEAAGEFFDDDFDEAGPWAAVGRRGVGDVVEEVGFDDVAGVGRVFALDATDDLGEGVDVGVLFAFEHAGDACRREAGEVGHLDL